MTFPEYGGARFSAADVEEYLTELAENGWLVSTRKAGKGYVLEPSEETKIDILHSPRTNEWVIQVSPDIEDKLPFSCDRLLNSMHNFQQCIAEAAEYLGVDLNHPPISYRLESAKPATNRMSLAKMTCHSKVEGIFDPYFDNKAIATLMTLIGLGMRVDEKLRILTSSKARKHLTEEMLGSFSKEFGLLPEVRLVHEKSHRRFFLLANAESLIIGPSLNSLDHNEVLIRENSPQDADFFEIQWKQATCFF